MGEGSNSLPASATLQSPLPLAATMVSGNQLQLSWTTNDNGGTFTAYYASGLTLPVTWTLTTNAPVLTGNQWMITLPVGTNASGFYRLQQSP